MLSRFVGRKRMIAFNAPAKMVRDINRDRGFLIGGVVLGILFFYLFAVFFKDLSAAMTFVYTGWLVVKVMLIPWFLFNYHIQHGPVPVLAELIATVAGPRWIGYGQQQAHVRLKDGLNHPLVDVGVGDQFRGLESIWPRLTSHLKKRERWRYWASMYDGRLAG